jgi:hypothetical protein
MKKTILTLSLALLFGASLLTAQAPTGPIVVQVSECTSNSTGISEGKEDATVSFAPLGEIFTNASGSATLVSNEPVGTLVKVRVNNGSLSIGVNAWDMELISQYILNVTPFNSYCQFIAADVNGSGTITTFDIVELRRLILGTSNASSGWRFWNADQVIDPANPFGVPLEEEIEVVLDTVNPELKFVGVQLGDVDGSNNFTGSGAVVTRSIIQLPERLVLPGETFTLSVAAPADYAAWQMTLELDQLTVEEIIPHGALNVDHFGLFPQENGTQLTFATEAPQQSFDLRLRARSGGFLSEMVRTSDKITRSLSFDGNGNGSHLALQFGLRKDESIQLAPNPWRNNALVTFTAAQPEKVTVTVLNALGQEVYQHTENYPPGQHQLELNRQQVPLPGIYWCKMARNNQVETLKFVVE